MDQKLRSPHGCPAGNGGYACNCNRIDVTQSRVSERRFRVGRFNCRRLALGAISALRLSDNVLSLASLPLAVPLFAKCANCECLTLRVQSSPVCPNPRPKMLTTVFPHGFVRYPRMVKNLKHFEKAWFPVS
jgi:hypothetical protein